MANPCRYRYIPMCKPGMKIKGVLRRRLQFSSYAIQAFTIHISQDDVGYIIFDISSVVHMVNMHLTLNKYIFHFINHWS